VKPDVMLQDRAGRSRAREGKAVWPGRAWPRRRRSLCFDFIGILLDEGVAVLGEAAGGGEEQSPVLGAFGEEGFHQFQAEGTADLMSFRIVVAENVVPPPARASPTLLTARRFTEQPGARMPSVSNRQIDIRLFITDQKIAPAFR